MTVSINREFAQKIAAYAADVDAYAAKVAAYGCLFTLKQFAEAAVMPSDRPEVRMQKLVTIYEAENGFFAEVIGGGTVVGMTLSDLCEALQSAVATAKLRAESERQEKAAMAESWTLTPNKAGAAKTLYPPTPSDPLGQGPAQQRVALLKPMWQEALRQEALRCLYIARGGS